MMAGWENEYRFPERIFDARHSHDVHEKGGKTEHEFEYYDR